MIERLTRISVLLAIVLAIPAAAHNRIVESAPANDFRSEGAAQDRVQPLPIFTASSFPDVAHLKLPSRSTVEQLSSSRTRSSTTTCGNAC
jgi:hypothetical protein